MRRLLLLLLLAGCASRGWAHPECQGIEYPFSGDASGVPERLATTAPQPGWPTPALGVEANVTSIAWRPDGGVPREADFTYGSEGFTGPVVYRLEWTHGGDPPGRGVEDTFATPVVSAVYDTRTPLATVRADAQHFLDVLKARPVGWIDAFVANATEGGYGPQTVAPGAPVTQAPQGAPAFITYWAVWHGEPRIPAVVRSTHTAGSVVWDSEVEVSVSLPTSSAHRLGERDALHVTVDALGAMRGGYKGQDVNATAILPMLHGMGFEVQRLDVGEPYAAYWCDPDGSRP